jgi:hypothetical protein
MCAWRVRGERHSTPSLMARQQARPSQTLSTYAMTLDKLAQCLECLPLCQQPHQQRTVVSTEGRVGWPACGVWGQVGAYQAPFK